MSLEHLLLASSAGSSAPPWPPAPRAPLGPLPPDTMNVLPWDPPVGDRRFLRANAWSITLPGAPIIPAGSTKQPQRILSYLLDRYPREWQEKWLDANAARGYSHIVQSVADMMANPVSPNPAQIPPGGGMSLQQVIDFFGRLSERGWVLAFFGSKYFQPSNMSTQQWIDWIMPLLEPILAAGVIEEAVPGWEWDLWNLPGEVSLSVHKAVGKRMHAAGKLCFHHFSTHYTSWFADGDPDGRFGYWYRKNKPGYPDGLNEDVDGILYQSDAAWSHKERQDRIVDTLWQYGLEPRKADGQPMHILRSYEPGAPTMQFDGDHPTEDESDLIGFLDCCTYDNVKHTDAKVWGYGDGGRRPPGTGL